MHTRLEKIIPAKNQYRFYSISVTETLFGDWALTKEWGRIGSRGGQQCTEWFSSVRSAVEALEKVKGQKERKGYVARPQQLWLPL